MEVGCGQCLGCRLDHSRMWAMRIVHESSLYEFSGGNCFITLTYRDERDCSIDQLKHGLHVPKDWSLDKKHFQTFMKRLRYYFPDRDIRYFAAGEYGRNCEHGINLELVNCPCCNTGRPHFHACLFNCRFTDLESYQSDGAVIRYTSPLLEQIWGYGFVDVGELNFSSASYTARYILKKVKDVTSDHHYMKLDDYGVVTFLTPEFILMSRGRTCKLHKGLPYQVDCPNCSRGIGRDWFERYRDDIYPSDEVPVPGHGVMNGVPRYYDDVLRASDPVLYDAVKAARQEYRTDNANEYTFERLLDKHLCKKARLKLKNKREL